MIYDKNGNVVSVPYDKNGNQISRAYDKNGNLVYPDEQADLSVMSYNVQFFNGINAQSNMQTAIMRLYNPDIVGLQELGTLTPETLPAVGTAMLNGYNLQFSNHKNKVGFASKYPLTNIVVADFANQDPEDASRYGETRAYMVADINVNGKTIKWINTHLCYLTAEYKYLQMAEIFALAENYEYVIITGDFNVMGYDSVESDEYVRMMKPFVDAGYNVANNNGISHTNTYVGSATVTSLSEFTSPPDDIITSSNIDILSVTYDTTKLSYKNGSVIDHIPVIALLKINE